MVLYALRMFLGHVLWTCIVTHVHSIVLDTVITGMFAITFQPMQLVRTIGSSTIDCLQGCGKSQTYFFWRQVTHERTGLGFRLFTGGSEESMAY
jgi:hypothetical protein